MKNLKNSTTLTCLMIIGFLFLSPIEIIGQVKKMSAKELTEKSTAVLYGKCIGKRCEWNDNKSIIYTYITVAPEEYIKGNLGSQVVIAIPGGRVDDIIYEVSEMPVIMEGEELVAFIWTNPSGKNLVTGGFQGKMKIEKDKQTGKRMVLGVGNLEETDQPDQAPGQIKKAENMKLEDFVGKLKGYARN